MLNKEGNLKEHIKETESKESRIIKEKNGMSWKKKITARTDQGKTNSLTHVSCKQNCMLLKRGRKYQKVGCKK